jgi:hypothetical protein
MSPKQLSLPFPPMPTPPAGRHAAAVLLRLSLEARIGEAVHLTVTDNLQTMISVRRRPDGAHALRVHHMFLGADAATVKLLARYVERRDARTSRELGRFIAAHRHLLDTRVRRTLPPILRTRGRWYDLGEIFADLDRQHFGGVRARITWGMVRRGRRRRSLKLGSYSVEDRLIRIHPVLDQPFVPRFFVEWIVFHEMLHDVVGVAEENGRRSYHPPEFRERERAFEHYERARAWERQHLDLLLRSVPAPARPR